MKFIYVVLALFAVASAQLEDGEDVSKTSATINVNDMLDLMNPYISKLVLNTKLDPLKLPNVSQHFWAVTPTLPPFPSKGLLVLKSGLLHKLSTIKRDGNATLKYENKTLHFDTGIQFAELFANYDYSARIFLINHIGKLKATAVNVRVKLNVSFDVADYFLTLNNLKVLSIGSIQAQFKGNKALDWLINALSKTIVPMFKDSLIKSIEETAAKAIQRYFDQINVALIYTDVEDQYYEMNEIQIAERLKSFLDM